MKLRIVSDGTESGTFVTDQYGNVVKGVTSITWQIGPATGGSTATAQIILTNIPVDLIGEGEI